MDFFEALTGAIGATIEVFSPNRFIEGTLVRSGEGSFDVLVTSGSYATPTTTERFFIQNVSYVRIHS
ncbi:hypothetical protein SK3146_05917 [Paenibacillus konkukensis]|uniref:Uncharacterized protein n=1 Tax=Paenibacillus konkukensis TaxID=2020716 RepID=A0ABY4RZ26_9BACL|nr:hypothetical protein SK3146_05917 [Paenibacillus konkukensis]